MLCGPTRPRAARRPPFVREQVPAHEHRLPPQVARSRFRGLFGRAPAFPMRRDLSPTVAELCPVRSGRRVTLPVPWSATAWFDWSGRGSDTEAVGWFGRKRSELAMSTVGPVDRSVGWVAKG
jgi:hypothetical protein